MAGEGSGGKQLASSGQLARAVSVSPVRAAIIHASRRFKEDVEAKVQPKKNFENIPKFLVL